MHKAVLTSSDFWSDLLLMGMGAAALILENDLRVGTAARCKKGCFRSEKAFGDTCAGVERGSL